MMLLIFLFDNKTLLVPCQFRYGGIYLDSDIIVLNSLHPLKNFVSIEDSISGKSVFNGAVMAFDKNR